MKVQRQQKDLGGTQGGMPPGWDPQGNPHLHRTGSLSGTDPAAEPRPLGDPAVARSPSRKHVGFCQWSCPAEGQLGVQGVSREINDLPRLRRFAIWPWFFSWFPRRPARVTSLTEASSARQRPALDKASPPPLLPRAL